MKRIIGEIQRVALNKKFKITKIKYFSPNQIKNMPNGIQYKGEVLSKNALTTVKNLKSTTINI